MIGVLGVDEAGGVIRRSLALTWTLPRVFRRNRLLGGKLARDVLCCFEEEIHVLYTD